MTKPCKSCKEQIDVAATKCPKCQAVQQWYKNPQYFGFIFVIPILAFSYYNTTRLTNRPNFFDYREKIQVSTISEEESKQNPREILLTIQVENKTEKNWKRPKFQVQSLDVSGNVIVAENFSDYNLVIGKNSSAITTLTLRVIPLKSVASRKITLTDLDSDLF